MNGKVKSVCTICGNVEYHPLALHNKCGSWECKGIQHLPEDFEDKFALDGKGAPQLTKARKQLKEEK